jgi:hypothetical protein
VNISLTSESFRSTKSVNLANSLRRSDTSQICSVNLNITQSFRPIDSLGIFFFDGKTLTAGLSAAAVRPRGEPDRGTTRRCDVALSIRLVSEPDSESDRARAPAMPAQLAGPADFKLRTEPESEPPLRLWRFSFGP